MARAVDLSRAVPDLGEGVTLLRRPGRRSTALHDVVLGALADRDGPAYWIDARNDASSHLLYELAPSPRSVAHVRIARAFTAYQHHELVRTLPRRLRSSASLVVAPGVADLYRDDDVPAPEDRDYLAATLAVLEQVADVLGIPVLVSTARRDAMADLVADRAAREIDCRETRAGRRYEAEGFETQVYRGDGFWQTTIPYWVDLLGAATGVDPAVVAREIEPADVGSGVEPGVEA